MRIVCPHCDATYDVPQVVAPGQAMRCTRCGHQWKMEGGQMQDAAVVGRPEMAEGGQAQAQRSMDEPAFAAAPQPPRPMSRVQPAPTLQAPTLQAPTSRAPRRTEPPPRRGGAGVATAWILSIAVLAALAWGAYARRGDVMHAWPPSIRVYAALGLDHP